MLCEQAQLQFLQPLQGEPDLADFIICLIIREINSIKTSNVINVDVFIKYTPFD